MKKINSFAKVFLAIAMTFAMIACENKEPETPDTPDTPASGTLTDFDASSKTTWHYFNLETGKVVGTGIAQGADQESDDAAWKARTDWDVAICRYKVRTNSGTSGDAQGGVFTSTETVLANLTAIPAASEFVADLMVEEPQMDGSTLTEAKSTAVVAKMEGMPPTWLKSPIYIIKGNGDRYFKVEFTSYKNADGESGFVSFNYAQMAK